MTVPLWFWKDVQTVLDVLHTGDAVRAAFLLQCLFDTLAIGE